MHFISFVLGQGGGQTQPGWHQCLAGLDTGQGSKPIKGHILLGNPWTHRTSDNGRAQCVISWLMRGVMPHAPSNLVLALGQAWSFCAEKLHLELSSMYNSIFPPETVVWDTINYFAFERYFWSSHRIQFLYLSAGEVYPALYLWIMWCSSTKGWQETVLLKW